MLLIGLGLRHFSVTSIAIPEVKKICRSVSVEDCERVAEHVKKLDNAQDIKNYLKEELHKVAPELHV